MASSLKNLKFSEIKLEKSFLVLGLPKQSDWKQIHNAYLTLAKQWHPDRSNADEKLAAEKIRELNTAYSYLKAYNRTLKLYTSSQGTARNNQNKDNPNYWSKTVEDLDQGEDNELKIVPKTKEGFRTHPIVHTKKKPRKPSPAFRAFKRHTAPNATVSSMAKGAMGAALTITIILVVGYGAITVYQKWPGSGPNELAAQSPSELLADQMISKYELESNVSSSKSADKNKPTTFTYGDSDALVIEVQGYPDLTTQGVWYYGDSAIVFEAGKVTSWTSTSANPLKTANE